jgi:cellulose synthase/poly-beta-1,6-N-acetylglucosamine synthase-like glycosyltransferase
MMEMFVSSPVVFAAGLLTIFVAVFCVEIIAAITLPRWQRPMDPNEGIREPVAVLVPAHNESAGLLATIADIRRQLLPRDRLLVVADNCTDDTAAVALSAGAEVLERHDSTKRGKGHALDLGLQHLSLNSPAVVIVIDADCRVGDHTIDRLARTCLMAHRPVQALDLMTAPEGSGINQKVAEFAWRVKNWLRPLGLGAVGLPCQLMGTGMAFPWGLIASADLANGCLVEDLKLGLDLTSDGHPPMFCPSACVISEFPSSIRGVRIQRKRWEQGHLNTIVSTVPRLLRRAIARADWQLLALTLDLAVPPLSLLGMLLIGMLGVAVLTAIVGSSSLALTITAANLLAFLLATFFAWLKCGRDVLPPRTILSAAPYLFGKLGLYRDILFSGTNAQWIRTDRTKPD